MEEESPKPLNTRSQTQRTIDKKARATHAFITDQEMYFAHLIRKGNGMDVAAAAEHIEMPLEHATELVESTRFKEYQAAYTKMFAHELAQREANEFMQYEISRAAFANLALNLARIQPDRTKGSIVGQVEALKLAAHLAQFLGPSSDPDKFFSGRTEEEMRYYADHGRFPEDVRKKNKVQ